MVNMIVLVGIPGCGKSTFADILCRNGNVIRLSSDEIRKELSETNLFRETTTEYSTHFMNEQSFC